MEDWHNFGPDYDRTLMAWYENFTAAWPQLSGHIMNVSAACGTSICSPVPGLSAPESTSCGRSSSPRTVSLVVTTARADIFLACYFFGPLRCFGAKGFLLLGPLSPSNFFLAKGFFLPSRSGAPLSTLICSCSSQTVILRILCSWSGVIPLREIDQGKVVKDIDPADTAGIDLPFITQGADQIARIDPVDTTDFNPVGDQSAGAARS